MLVLRISLDVGPSASPMKLESLVKGIRVATDVGTAAELIRIKREALGLMKYPTDGELSSALERLPEGSESTPWYQARRLLEARSKLREEAPRFPPEFWFEYWYEGRGGDRRLREWLKGTGYERALAGGPPVPSLSSGPTSLDAINPTLYQALVGDYLRHHAPDQEISVREIIYQNPFGEVLAGAGAAASSLEKAAGVIETSATLGARRKLKKVEAEVAEATLDDQVDSVRIDVELKRERLRREQIESEIAAEELIARRIANARALEALSLDRKKNALVDHFTASGMLDEVEALAQIDSSDVDALLEFAASPPELERSYELDPID